jgi:heptosyltransferase II
MNTLILKLNATGDVVRTSTLLHRLDGEITWVTAAANVSLLDGASPRVRCVSWDAREKAADVSYDLVINLEDEPEVAAFARSVRHGRLFGAYMDGQQELAYTDDARAWFDLSLISKHGRAQADRLKLENRRTYQELIFEGLGWQFQGEPYVLPAGEAGPLAGDVAISDVAGPVWPMKNWAYYGELRQALEAAGLRVNVLPRRSTLLEHLADVRGHRCLVSGDSLPMHLALGSGVRCVTLFTCTSPWEIHGYGLQTQMVSPLLDKYFYQRGFDEAAVRAIGVGDVYDAVLAALEQHSHGPQAQLSRSEPA